MELHAAGVLAALGATVFAAQCAAARARLAVLLATFAVAVALLARLAVLDVAAVAYCMAAAQAAALVRPGWSMLPPIAGGIAAACWVSILQGQGLPWLPAVLAAAAVLSAAVGLALRRTGFMSAEVRDEAAVLVGLFALLLATGPEVVDGWRSALALTAEPLPTGGPNVGLWLGALVVACVLLGAAYTLWKRR